MSRERITHHISLNRIKVLASDQPTAVWELRDLARTYLDLHTQVQQLRTDAARYKHLKQNLFYYEDSEQPGVTLWRADLFGDYDDPFDTMVDKHMARYK